MKGATQIKFIIIIIRVVDGINNKVVQALSGESATPVRATIVKKGPSRPPNANGRSNIGSQGPHWAQQLVQTLSW